MASMHPEYGEHWNDKRGGESLATQVWKRDGSRRESWRTPQSSDGEGGVMEMREGAGGKYKLRDHVAHEEKTWATPTARDNKSGRGNEDRQYKELTPMVERQQSGKLNPRWVETLMGVPIGWTMPSCTSPVTIAPTSSDSSETE
jgi:hypothetical protein